MTGFEKPRREESREKYARFWFDGLSRFHRIENAAVWEFDEAHVRASLRSKLEKGMPTRKRIKSVEDLIWYSIMARRRRAPPVADVILSSHSGCDRCPTGTSPARGKKMEQNLRKDYLLKIANFRQPSVTLRWRSCLAY